MAKMQESGMGGMSMYGRDDMDEMMANGGFGDDPYGDDPYGDGYGDLGGMTDGYGGGEF